MCSEFNCDKKLRVLLVGGGNSTLCLAPLCAAAGHAVSVLTRKPDKWAEEITVVSDHQYCFWFCSSQEIRYISF